MIEIDRPGRAGEVGQFGPLRQYLPKGSNLAVHEAEALAAIAAELNGRPRESLDWDTPAERFAALLDSA